MKRITIGAVAVFAIGSTVLVLGDQGSRRFQEFLNGFGRWRHSDQVEINAPNERQ